MNKFNNWSIGPCHENPIAKPIDELSLWKKHYEWISTSLMSHYLGTTYSELSSHNEKDEWIYKGHAKEKTD